MLYVWIVQIPREIFGYFICILYHVDGKIFLTPTMFLDTLWFLKTLLTEFHSI